MPTKSTTETAAPKNLNAVFTRLKKILTPYTKEFKVTDNTPTVYNLIGSSKNKTPKRFGGVALRKNYVTFYSCPTLLAQNASPAL